MRTCLLFLALVVLFSCEEDDSAPDDTAALNKACAKCNLNVSEMNWLAVKFNEARTVPGKMGSFWAIQTSEGVVIVYQQAIMSCIGCQRYDCHGNTATLSEQVVMNELIPGMNSFNLIFEMVLE